MTTNKGHTIQAATTIMEQRNLLNMAISNADLKPMAIEYGQWKGVRDETTLHSGIYSAK